MNNLELDKAEKILLISILKDDINDLKIIKNRIKVKRYLRIAQKIVTKLEESL